jgi:tripartite-type tricarboxylate transporter receptor subunit TctC
MRREGTVLSKKGHLLLLAMAGLAVVVGAAQATTHEFYQGKTIRIIVGLAAGGGFDTYSRAIARYMGKHIPGHPALIVENMTGAGSLIAANYVYKIAKPDGLTIGNFVGGLIGQQLLGNPGIEFDARKFEWIGVPVQDNVACALTKASGITNMEQWMTAKTPVKLGATAPGSPTYDVPRVLMSTLGLPIQVVAGYKGTAEIRLAADGGEVAGGCWAWESIKVTWRQALETGEVLIVLQTVPAAHPDLPEVPVAITFAKSDEARRLIEAGIHSPSAITRPYSLPPGTPKERVQILRKAFMDTLKDAEFRAEAEKLKLDVDPVPGDVMARIVAELFTLEPSVIAKLKETLTPK